MAGGVFHVYARGNDRRVIFVDDADRRQYLAMLAGTVARLDWHCLAYCLMDNHVHLLVETPVPNLGRGMQWFHGHYAREFNARHDSVGHLFQGRYGAARTRTESHLLAATAYIACNPSEAGICLSPDAWRWSSYTAVLGGRAPRWLALPRLLRHFAALGGNPLDRYRQIVIERHLRRTASAR